MRRERNGIDILREKLALKFRTLYHRTLERPVRRFRAWWSAQPRWRQWAYGLGVPAATVLFAVGLLFSLVYLEFFGALPTYAQLSNVQNDQASAVLAEDGTLLGKYYVENRVDVPVSEISPFLIEGLIATEDARFFEHRGIDLRAFGRVVVKSILLRDESAGGGSTLSQQLAKNLYPRRNYWLLAVPVNKMREMIVARRLEKLYTKEELLGLYLNTVPFGDNAFGVKVAAERFFNKDVGKLQLEEAAVLVGMLKANTYYNPRRFPERARERRNVVLTQMLRYGTLDSAVVDSIQQLPLLIDYQPEDYSQGLATYFREHLRREIDAILADHPGPNGKPYNLYRDGLRIYTTIDAGMQAYAEAAMRKEMPLIQANFNRDWANRDRVPWEDLRQQAIRQSERFKHLTARGNSDTQALEILAEPVATTIFDWNYGVVDTLISPLDSIDYSLQLLSMGLLAVEPRTGLVRTWVGGISQKFRQYDHVKSERQIGSTMKPIVYATALENGMLPCEYTPNERQTYAQYANYSPRNSDGKYEGVYSMRGALTNSINTIAVETGLRAGLDKVSAQARQMGIEGRLRAIPSLALGSEEASLWEMVRVYSTFANRGLTPARLHYLDRIETADGTVIVDFDRPARGTAQRTLSQNTADVMTYLLQGVIDNGTAGRLRRNYGLRGPLAGKTGTTQSQSDGWFLGYTPNLVVGAWVGAEYPTVHFRTLRRGQAASTALPVWGRFLRHLYRDRGYRNYRSGNFPELADTTYAYLQCPDYLEEMPIYMDSLEEAYYRMLIATYAQFREMTPLELRDLLQDQPIPRENEAPQDYQERLERFEDREERRDERRQRRKEFWSRLLFKKDGRDGG